MRMNPVYLLKSFLLYWIFVPWPSKELVPQIKPHPKQLSIPLNKLPSDKELFFCDQCPQVYISKQSLSDHVSYTHTGQKQKKKQEHKCPHCDKVFKMQQNYREHVKVKHEKSTPYKCDQCNRAYGTLIKLRNHKKLVHERVKCEECGKDICNSFILKRHKASVHGIKPSDAFQCELCPMFYDKKTYLNNHIAKHHFGT